MIFVLRNIYWRLIKSIELGNKSGRKNSKLTVGSSLITMLNSFLDLQHFFYSICNVARARKLITLTKLTSLIYKKNFLL
jgi:hypothetical protein